MSRSRDLPSPGTHEARDSVWVMLSGTRYSQET